MSTSATSAMGATAPPPRAPRVAAVLVVTDGGDWLGSVLATIAAQRYPALDLVVVDNASRDASADLLSRRIPSDRLLTLPRRVGFGRAVGIALQHAAVDTADLVLLLHDDLVLAPDTIARLVEAMVEDEGLGIVGPKLREWSDDYLLQEVGMTVDRLGRAETTLEANELDQGQHDRQRDVLYVSTAGMLVRREVLAGLGGFDARFPALRDDLDLCWRAWVTGSRVEVVPAAIGYHIAATSRGVRPVGRGRPWEPRYLAERHSLAALLKCYGVLRLLWVLPVLVVLAVAKVLAFAATRRFGDAGAVARAYAWNVGQLPRTLRRRRAVQRRRERSDGELARLFAPGLPRVRSYAEHLGEWLAGGSTTALLDDADAEAAQRRRARSGNALTRAVRDRPALTAGILLLLVYLVGLAGLLGSGQLVGGQVAPWPESARDFLRAYASPWNGDPVGSSAFASPAQALLGFLSFLGVGSAWLAQRLLVFGLLPLAWLLAVRAGRLVTMRPGPRVLGATLYTLSPTVLGGLAQGRYGALVVAALLPGLLLLVARTADTTTPSGSAWRAAALLALGLAISIAAAPTSGPLLAAALLLVIVLRAARSRPGSRQALVRLVVAALGAGGLLAPWLVALAGGEGIPAIPLSDPLASLPLWRALAGVPDVLPGLDGVLAVLLAVMAAAVVLAGVLLGVRARPGAVLSLVVVIVVTGLAAWAAVRAGVTWLWAPGLLLPAALAQAGLGIVAARYVGAELGSYAFGLRQIVVVLAAALVALGVVGSVARLGTGPWSGLRLEPELVPAFVGADADRVGPYRVLVVEPGAEGVRWDVTGPGGPTMAEFGTMQSDDLLAYLDTAVADAVGGSDLSAGTRLGLANVRYVVVDGAAPAPGGEAAAPADATAAVDAVMTQLDRQPALEPLPSGGGQVYRVRSWLPRAAVLPADRAALLATTGDLGDLGELEETGLRRTGGGVYRGEVDTGDGTLVVSEESSPLWQASVAGERLPRAEAPSALGEWPVNAFRLEGQTGAAVTRVVGGLSHRVVIGAQLLLLLLLVSLALRPPGFTQGRAVRQTGRSLPVGLAGDARGDDGDGPAGSSAVGTDSPSRTPESTS